MHKCDCLCMRMCVYAVVDECTHNLCTDVRARPSTQTSCARKLHFYSQAHMSTANASRGGSIRAELVKRQNCGTDLARTPRLQDTSIIHVNHCATAL